MMKKKKLGLILAMLTQCLPTYALATTVLEQAPGYDSGLMQQRAEDLRVKVMGGEVIWLRDFAQGRWSFNPQWSNVSFGTLPTAVLLKDAAKETVLEDKTVLYRNGDAYHLDHQAPGRVYRHDAHETIEQTKSGFVWRNRDGDWIRYDMDGVIAAYGHGALETATFTHNASRQMTAVNDRHGQTVLTLVYDEDRLVSVTDRVGRTVRYTWQDALLVAVTDVNGLQWHYEYDQNETLPIAMRRFTDPQLRSWTFTNRMVGGEIAQICDSKGQQWRMVARPVSVHHQDRHDEAGEQQDKAKPAHSSSSPVIPAVHDIRGKVLAIAPAPIPNTTDCQTVAIPRRMITESVTNHDGLTEHYGYAYHRRQQAHYQYHKDTAGRETETYFDKDGAVTHVRSVGLSAPHAPHVDASHVDAPYVNKQAHTNKSDQRGIRVEYHPQWNKPTRIINEDGVVTTLTYDGDGMLTQRVEAFGLPEQLTVDYQYNDHQLLSQMTVQGRESHQVVTYNWVYDTHGNRVKDIVNDAVILEYKAFTITGQPQIVIDGRGKTWRYRYDKLGRVVQATDPNKQFISYQYDNVGNLVAIIDKNKQKTQLVYNADNQRVKTVYPDDSHRAYAEAADLHDLSLRHVYSQNAHPQPVYPAYLADALTAESHGNDWQQAKGLRMASAHFQYDAFDQVRQRDVDGDVTRYQYSLFGAPTRIEAPDGQITDIEYDVQGRAVRQQRAGLGFWTWQYDGNGNVTRITDSNQSALDFVYDDANRLRQERWYTHPQSSSLSAATTLSYQYDNAGQLMGWHCQSGKKKTAGIFTRDTLGRITAESVDFGPFTKRYQYAYTPEGLLQSLTMPDGRVFDYEYDAQHRLIRVRIPGEGSITVRDYVGKDAARGDFALPREEMLPGGIVRHTHYGKAMDDTAVIETAAIKTAVITPVSVTVKNAHQQTLITLGANMAQGGYYSSATATPAITTTTTTTIGTTEEPFGELAVTASPHVQAFSPSGQLVSQNTRQYRYDSQGNVIEQTVEQAQRTLIYDARDRLQRVIETDIETDIETSAAASLKAKPRQIAFDYDPLDRRISKTVDGVTTYYLYGAMGLLAEYDQQGNLLRSYGYRPDAVAGDIPLFMHTADGAYYYYHADPQGQPAVLTDRTGQIVWSASMPDKAWRTSMREESPPFAIDNPIHRAGRYYDRETHLYYSQARYYDPEMGRYLTPSRHPLIVTDNLYTEAGATRTAWDLDKQDLDEQGWDKVRDMKRFIDARYVDANALVHTTEGSRRLRSYRRAIMFCHWINGQAMKVISLWQRLKRSRSAMNG
ncbi:wall-associated protein precursor [Photobacterium aphoticum]|uniref:Wall-associated protein n=1 Tax=Photobacterium aphoticum TaxID=754436 RepID=A0A090QKJ1_9GAMM|nr:wall-associated protein precursor [Photobacterium aphoticum]